MITITLAELILATVGITEIIKRTIGIDNTWSSRLAPSIALLIGIVLSFGAYDVNFNAVFTGIVVGLSASGLWSGTKTALKG